MRECMANERPIILYYSCKYLGTVQKHYRHLKKCSMYLLKVQVAYTKRLIGICSINPINFAFTSTSLKKVNTWKTNNLFSSAMLKRTQQRV